MSQQAGVQTRAAIKDGAVVAILLAISFSHMLNDIIQSLIPAIYPLLKDSFALDYAQIGLITLTFQITASLLQPLVGLYTDRYPLPYSVALGMGFSLAGLLVLSAATHFAMLLLGAGLVGLGSSVFHPESARIARMASGGKHGMAQSIFQVGGNFGQALGPLLAAFIIVPHGQGSIAWFSAVALLAMAVLWAVGGWYARNRLSRSASAGIARAAMSRGRIAMTLAVLIALLFSKFFYLSSLSSYLTFYMIEHFGVSTQNAQLHLFAFMAAVAAGVMIGGPVGDRIGRKPVIWASILGVLPFTLMLPHANLFWTGVLTVAIGLIIASASSAIIVYAQELLPGKPGTIGGLFFGLAFGMGGLGAAVLGWLADRTSIEYVYALCAWLPAIGLLAVLLPNTRARA